MHDPSPLRLLMSKERSEDGVPRCLGASQIISFHGVIFLPCADLPFPSILLVFPCHASPQLHITVTTVFREGGLCFTIAQPQKMISGGFYKVKLRFTSMEGDLLSFLLQNAINKCNKRQLLSKQAAHKTSALCFSISQLSRLNLLWII